MLLRYPWPGNVRELANAVDRAVLLCRGDVLRPADFDLQIREVHELADYNLDVIERLAIERALAATGGNRTRAARLLGVGKSAPWIEPLVDIGCCDDAEFVVVAFSTPGGSSCATWCSSCGPRAGTPSGGCGL